MRTSDERSDAAAAARAARNARVRVYLAVYWVVWAFWLVLRPRNETTAVTADARKQLAIFGFAIVFLICYGLLREWRWPVTASRALLVATAVGTIIGPAGRPVAIYMVDVAFFLAGAIPAFFILQMGTASLERSGISDRMRAARTQRFIQKRSKPR